MVRIGYWQMDDTTNKEILRTFFDGKIGCIEYSDKWLPQLEEFCEVAKSLGYINNESPEAMKIDEIQYHCMIHIPTNKIYAVAGVQYMPEYKEGYYRIWTRLSRIPMEDIPMTRMTRYGRGEMPEFDGLLYFNCDWACVRITVKQHLVLHLQIKPMQIIMLEVQILLQIMLLKIGGVKRV